LKKDSPPSELVADLVWADLYASRIRKELKLLTPVVKKMTTGAGLEAGAAKLRQQLEGAHRTTAELKTMARPAARRSKPG
jgi:hypothetical protein